MREGLPKAIQGGSIMKGENMNGIGMGLRRDNNRDRTIDPVV